MSLPGADILVAVTAASEAVGLFISDTSTALADFRPNDQLRRHATALPSHVTLSHTRYTVTPRSENSAGPETVPARPGRNVGYHPGGHGVFDFKNIAFEKGSVLVPSA